MENQQIPEFNVQSQNNKVTIVQMNYAWEWLTTSWALVRNNYGLALSGAALVFCVNLVLGKIPFLGVVLGSVFSGLMAAGFFSVAAKWTRLEKTKFEDYFLAFNNAEIRQRTQPYVIFNVAFNLATKYWAHFDSLMGFQGSMLLLLVFLAGALIGSFCLPLMLFRKLSFRDALTVSFDGIQKNIGVVSVGVLVGVGVLIVSTLLLLIPLIFVVLPVIFVLGYVIFATIFEDLSLSDLRAKLDEQAKQDASVSTDTSNP